MVRFKGSTDEFLGDSQVAITNGKTHPEVQALLSLFNYNEAKLEEGEALLNNANALLANFKVEYGQQIKSTLELEQSREVANKKYSILRKVAKIALRNLEGTDLYRAMCLNERIKKNWNGWHTQVRLFYTNGMASEEAMEKMVLFGITLEKMQEGKDAFLLAVEKNNAQETEIGEAQKATQLKDEAFDALNDWMRDYIAIARLALADDPQLLEILGITVKA